MTISRIRWRTSGSRCMRYISRNSASLGASNSGIFGARRRSGIRAGTKFRSTFVSARACAFESGKKPPSCLPEVGQVYFGEVGHFYIGANTYTAGSRGNPKSTRTTSRRSSQTSTGGSCHWRPGSASGRALCSRPTSRKRRKRVGSCRSCGAR